jgi:RNA recognition motif-containing protein
LSKDVQPAGFKDGSRPAILPLNFSPHSNSSTQGIHMKDIFVGNLDYETSEDELRQLFAAYGPVDRVSIVTDRYSGRPRGFAFVEMASAGDADKAIAELNGTHLHGRPLDVNEARRRPEHTGEDREGRERRRSGGRW